jgi:glutamyl/glutaminyl-tRNA synthetase
VRSNFLPTYNFANVVDDLQDEITHVFRGEEHITNTSKQLLLYQYLQKQPPQYGHLNVLVNSFFSSERYAKLSKRTFLKGEFSFFTSFYKNFNQTRTPTFESCFRDATINFLVFSG